MRMAEARVSEESPGEVRSPPRRPRWIPRFLIPTYDEASLFLMSVAFLLLLATDPGCRADWSSLLARGWSPGRICFVLLFPVGLLVSLVRVFSRRPASRVEKVLLVGFGVGLNALTGVWAGLWVLEHTRGWMLVFPVWNIASAVLLVLMYRLGYVDERNLVDRNAPRVSLVAGVLVVLLTWLVAGRILGAYWAVTLSLCVAYATNVNALLARLLVRGPARREAR